MEGGGWGGGFASQSCVCERFAAAILEIFEILYDYGEPQFQTPGLISLMKRLARAQHRSSSTTPRLFA
jgi:ribulose 1,5-bisphosphate synthetase/thiazole synthase